MKAIKINEKCNQCGVCVVKCPAYFAEDEEGNVKALAPSVNETAELKSAMDSCPEKAIELGEEVDIEKSIQEYMNQLNESGITVKREDIAFHEAYTRPVYVPSAGVSRYEYRSSSRAESAGYDAFVSTSYSQIDSLILERITDYRVTEIKPYYTTDNESVYAKNNQKIADILKAVSVLVGSDKLPSDFCSVDIYPDTNNTVWKMLNRGEIISDNFIGLVKREFNYSASEYRTYIDWDDSEDYRGKDVYNYNANDASRELGKDLGHALKWAKSDIEDGAIDYIKELVDSYNKNLKACLEKKIQAIKRNFMDMNLNLSITNSSIEPSPEIIYETQQTRIVVLRSSATEYYKRYGEKLYPFKTPETYYGIRWTLVGEFRKRKKLVSLNEVTIYVNANDIIEI